MAPKSQADPAWQHGTRLEKAHHWQCHHCNMISRGGGITRLKQHLAGGYPDVVNCAKVPPEVRKMFKAQLNNKKEERLKTAAQQAEFDRRATQDVSGGHYEARGGDNDEDPELEAGIRASLEHAEFERERMYYPGSQFEYGGGSGGGSGSGGISSVGSTSAAGAMDRSGPIPSGPYIGRSSSMRAPQTQSRGSSRGGLRGFFTNLGASGRRTNVDISDLDPRAFPPSSAKQQRIDDMYSKSKKWELGKAISKWFHFSRIPANAANNPYYRTMVSTIQKVGPGITPPTPYEISGPFLEEEVKEINQWIDRIKRQWGDYGCTLMCDSWTGPTRMSIINFLIYCNRRVIYHKSVNASDEVHSSLYISKLMKEVIEENGPENFVQIITDNGANFKRAGEIIELDYSHIYWTPCAAHCLDLMMKDIGDISMVNKTVKKGQQITRFIYNHTWVHALMRKFTEGEILRPGATRFATNFIALRSLQQRKVGLRSMFTSDEWSTSRYVGTNDGKQTEKNVLNTRFWDRVAEIVVAVEPLYKVLQQVEMEKTPQMGHLYYYIHQAQEEIKRVLISETKYKPFIDIISQRWEDQMGRDIHIAAYYLNPAYQYRYDLGTTDSFLYPLRKVIQRMSATTREAAQALNESKYFRDSSGNFGDPFAISCRDSMDPVEWWLQFGIEAPTLRKIATRILSQTTSSSGCERNWSTFSLIHTKPRNRLSYARLEKLVYVHYNMRLRMRTLQNEDIRHVDPFDVEFVQDDTDPIINWWSAMESDQPLLDEPGEPPQPSPIISDALESESQPEDIAITPLDSQRIRQARRRSKSDSPSSRSKGKKKATPSKAKGKAKGKRPIDPLEAIAEAEEDEEDEPSIHSSSSTKDGGDDDDDGAGGEDTVVPSTLPYDDPWTNEQYFDHATQYDDRGASTGQTTQVYKKRGSRRRGGPTALQDYHHDMMSSLQEVSESTYSVSSTYSTDDTGSSSWNPNKETLMSMWYNGYQGIMPWENFQIWALENYSVDLSRVCPEAEDMYGYDGRHSSAF